MLENKIEHMRELPVGVFSDYIGEPLKQKVAHLYPPTQTQSQKPSTPAPKLYLSDECCICYGNFDGSIKQVILTPCNHDLCAECCKKEFFEYKRNVCPKCQTAVDIEQLKKTLRSV